MPRATLEFNLPEEQTEFKLATQGSDYFCALGDVANMFRDLLKYKADSMTPEQYKKVEELSGQFWDIMHERGIDPMSDPQ
jgi:hypothetical protein